MFSDVTTEGNKMSKIQKVEFDTYATFDDLMYAVKNHHCSDEEPIFINDDYKDIKLMRLELGFKCTHCSESFRIAVRRLRTAFCDKPTEGN